MNIPTNYQTVMPYLIIKDAVKFLQFTENVFGATENEKNLAMRNSDIIMHAEIMIGGSTIMFADSNEQFSPRNAGLFVYVEDADATYKKALEEGANAVTQMSTQPYGRSGGIEDPFGNTWWITTPVANK